MKLIDLREEFIDYVRYYENTFPIWKNPTPKEIEEAFKEADAIKKYSYGLRFIADAKNKDFYIFPADLLHQKASEFLKINYSESNKNAVFGNAKPLGNKLEISHMILLEQIDDTNLSNLLAQIIGNNIDKKWGFADKYSNLTERLKKIDERLQMYIKKEGITK
jgi:hypothetical protein